MSLPADAAAFRKRGTPGREAGAAARPRRPRRARHLGERRMPARMHGLRAGEEKVGVRDQVGELCTLELLVPFLPRPALRPASLVPARGVAHRHEQPMNPAGELGVLPAIAGEGFVAAAHLVVERLGNPEIVAGRGAEEIVAPCRQVAGAGHVALRPGRVEGPVREQLPERSGAPADRLGIDALHGHAGAETEGQRVGNAMVPARVGRQQPRLRDDVAVKELEDAVRRRARAGIVRARASPKPHRGGGWRRAWSGRSLR